MKSYQDLGTGFRPSDGTDKAKLLPIATSHHNFLGAPEVTNYGKMFEQVLKLAPNGPMKPEIQKQSTHMPPLNSTLRPHPTSLQILL